MYHSAPWDSGLILQLVNAAMEIAKLATALQNTNAFLAIPTFTSMTRSVSGNAASANMLTTKATVTGAIQVVCSVMAQPCKIASLVLIITSSTGILAISTNALMQPSFPFLR